MHKFMNRTFLTLPSRVTILIAFMILLQFLNLTTLIGWAQTHTQNIYKASNKYTYWRKVLFCTFPLLV